MPANEIRQCSYIMDLYFIFSLYFFFLLLNYSHSFSTRKEYRKIALTVPIFCCCSHSGPFNCESATYRLHIPFKLNFRVSFHVFRIWTTKKNTQNYTGWACSNIRVPCSVLTFNGHILLVINKKKKKEKCYRSFCKEKNAFI